MEIHRRTARPRGVVGPSLLSLLALVVYLGGSAVSISSADAGCANQALRTGPSAGLPDCRAYEQVSPTDKNGNSVLLFTAGGAGRGDVADPILTAADGESALFAYGGADEQAPYGGFNTYRARRTGAGWLTASFAPPRREDRPIGIFDGPPKYLGASNDLSTALFYSKELQLPPPPFFNFKTRLTALSAAGEEQVSVGPLAGPDLSSAPFSGISEDGQRIFFQTPDAIDPAAAALEPSAPMLYERALGESTTRVVGILPNGDLAASGAILGSAPYTVEGNNVQLGQARTAISGDGSHVVFSAAPTVGAPREIYTRIDRDRTLWVSESQRSTPGAGPTLGTFFQGATPDGSDVFFLSDAQLSDDDSDSAIDLYRYAINAAGTGGTLTRITPDLGSESGQFDNAVALVGSSSDGETVYFVSPRQLGGQGTAGAQNLYVDDHGQISLVAVLAGTDVVAAQAAPNDIYFGSFRTPQVRLTPDGSRLVFQSTEQLSAFANGGHAEVYMATLGAPGIECVSCAIVGGAAGGDASLIDRAFEPIVAVPRNLSADGRQLFFQSDDPLVAADTNGRQDVYQWHDGVVGLVSGGRGQDDSLFLGASAGNDKRDAFFVTSDRLSWTDRDSVYDLYDARVGGGFAAPPDPPEPCLGDGCQGEAGVAPAAIPAGTSTLAGGGNDRTVRQRKSRCPKGQRKAKASRNGKARCTGKNRKRAASKNQGGKK